MFQPKNQPPVTTNIRMPKLPGTPGLDDFHFLLVESQRHRGRFVEMPWTAKDRAGSFCLAAKCEREGDPTWQLHNGDGSSAELLWSYTSGDIGLIFNLVMSECGAETDGFESVSSTYASPSSDTIPDFSTSTSSDELTASSQSTSGRHRTIRGTSKAILEGNLTKLHTPNLLQSINISALTGRLVINSKIGHAEVYFADGLPVHASTKDITGDQAIIDLTTWEQGEFHFYQDEKTALRSVNRRLEILLMEGVAVLDQLRYLQSQGITQDSYLMRTDATISEAEFEQRVSNLAPLDLNKQKAFYQNIDNKSTLLELLRKNPIPKPEWAALLFNLINAGLVSGTNQEPITKKSKPLDAMGVDRAAIQAVVKGLSRPETGILTYPALLYSLEQEFFRFESFNWPFSIIIFEARIRSNNPEAALEPLSSQSILELARRINSIKRNLDLLAHYETFDFALLLPNTTTVGASVLANRMIEIMLSQPLTPEMQSQKLIISMGVASIPNDCQDLGMLLSAAYHAKNVAKQQETPVIVFKDLNT